MSMLYSYPDILKMELGVLYKDDLMSKVMPKMQMKLKEITEGRVLHADNALNMLFNRFSLLLVMESSRRVSLFHSTHAPSRISLVDGFAPTDYNRKRSPFLKL